MPSKRLISAQEICDHYYDGQLTPATIRNRARSGAFAAPIKLGPRKWRWTEEEVLADLAERWPERAKALAAETGGLGALVSSKKT